MKLFKALFAKKADPPKKSWTDKPLEPTHETNQKLQEEIEDLEQEARELRPDRMLFGDALRILKDASLYQVPSVVDTGSSTIQVDVGCLRIERFVGVVNFYPSLQLTLHHPEAPMPLYCLPRIQSDALYVQFPTESTLHDLVLDLFQLSMAQLQEEIEERKRIAKQEEETKNQKIQQHFEEKYRLKNITQ